MLITALLCLLIGISLGLLGAGGSVLMVPVFIYTGGMGAQEAIALSLFVVALTSLTASVRYMTHHWVNLRLVLIFVLFGSICAWFGARLSLLLPEKILLLLFGLLMLLTGLILFSKDGERKETGSECRLRFFPAMLISSFLGILTGLLGVGGGFLIVPVLALIMKCSMRSAVGTSLLIIAANAGAGFAGHLAGQALDWKSAAVYLAATMAGAVPASFLAGRVQEQILKKLLAVLITATGAFVVFQNRPF